MKHKNKNLSLTGRELKSTFKPLVWLVVFLLFKSNGFSQDLFVGNDTYLYAKDVVVTVTNDIRLDTPTSNLYFRGDAQLYQVADIKNSDAGKLSIYQNQTTNIYEYNYWCSPVGVSVEGTAKANVPFNGSNIHDPVDDADISNVNSTAYLYTSAYNGTATALSNYWMYTLRDGEGYNSWNQILNTGNAGTGYGYTLKGSPNTNNVLDFRGRPNNGTIEVSCSFDGVDNQPNSGTPNYAETLTGNPYPSALDLKLFFVNSPNNQADLMPQIFFWEQKQNNSHYLVDYEGGYGTYAPGNLGDLLDNGTYTNATFENYNSDGGTIGDTSGNTTDFSANNSRRFAAVGQGFVIMSNVNGGNAFFENSMRVYLAEDSTPGGDGSIFARNGNSKTSKTNNSKKAVIAMSQNGVDYDALFKNPTIVPEIRLHTRIDNTFYKENVIAFRESTPNNDTYNRFYDATSINELSSDAYLISSDKKLAIKSINYSEATRLPIGFKASKNSTLFSIKIHKLNNVPNDVNVFLFDNLNNTYTDVKNGAFEVTLDKGTHNNRFEITFAKNTLDVADNTFTDFNVFQNNNISQLKLLNPNSLSITSIKVFDVSGKQVLVDLINSAKNEYKYSTKSLSDGVYIVKIESLNKQVFSKKVVISNK
ncbi:T9SS type A sorting domain-containing protein [Mariniflexile litorale]|uniref:T9SS type A sorting domain-containing protein n=1 Tax=Mariniflexile litorale TaxID=3045158 RepID=A0AAU7EEU6_9FLAO|nr:T9SS type A sorting domain-containing protein [Mariniflexile sp. KMM 9835]MDQ8213124.1 T9SS type A sorting domain-containing protein [Mariniflexile sp. KMM 9835]